MQTRTGLRRMAGAPYYSDEDDLFIESAALGVVSYPDQRVTKLFIYATEVTNDADGQWYVAELEAKKSLHNDLAYAVFGQQVSTRWGYTWDTFKLVYLPIAAATVDALPTTITDGDPNLVLVSEQYQPRMIYGRSALAVGNDADDAILKFDTPAVPVSDGQFGEFPVIAFCRRSIAALRSGTTTAFSQISPMSVNRGIIGRFASVNIGGTIFFLSTDGIYKLGEEHPISSTIQNSSHPNDLLRNIDADSMLGYFIDGRTGRRELWVATKNRIYSMSLNTGQWFTINETRRRLMSAYGGLWGVDQDGLKNEAGTDVSGYRLGTVQPAPLHLGSPEIMKRWRKVIVRYPQRDLVTFTQVSDYELTLQFFGVSDLIISIDIEAELRYGHRVRIRRDTRNAVSIYAGDASVINSNIATLKAGLEAITAQMNASFSAVNARISAIAMPVDTTPKGVEVNVPASGKTVEFPIPYASSTEYIPFVVGFSSDMSRNVSVGITLTAYNMTLYPAEDGAIIYWKAESLT